MRWKEINEAPIADFGTSGDLDKEGSFRASDLRAIRNQKWVEKVHDAFSKTEFDFNIYLHNADEGILNLGGKYYDAKDISELRKFHGLVGVPDVAKLIGFTPPKWQETITVLLTQNEGDERFPLTPWMLAHRVAHAFLYADRSPTPMLNQDITNFIDAFDKTFNDLVNELKFPLERITTLVPRDTLAQNYSNVMTKSIAKLIGTFRSAREGTVRDGGEFKVECFTQYLVNGAIKFNRPEIPGEPRIPAEEANPWLDKARAFYEKYSWQGTADDFARKNVRAVAKPYDGYLALDAKGNAMASFGGGQADPERTRAALERYQAQGLTIQKLEITPAAIKRYETYLEKVKTVKAMYQDWLDSGLVKGPKTSTTDRLDELLSKYEDRLNADIRRIIIRCIGRALVL